MESYLLTILLLLPLLGAIALIVVGRGEHPNENNLRRTALIFSLATFLFSLLLVFAFVDLKGGPQWEVDKEWISAFNLGIRYHMAVDGLSLWLVILTTFLMPVTLIASWNSVHSRLREFLVCMLVLETGMIGVFVAMDMFLFYLFWEVMLVPMYLLIGIWGGERRIYAAVKFVIYTVVGSLLMLAAIIALYYMHGGATGNFTFDIAVITNDLHSGAFRLSDSEQRWLFWGFALAFLIKVPLFPFHTWLPDAHVEAPTAGSVILAGVLLKMGTYGLMRFNLPMFPDASRAYATLICTLAVIGIIYGALVAMVQPDMKKLVAYSSVSHLGFVVLGIFSFTEQGMQGALYQMLNHGISTGALFIMVGMIYDRRHTRMIAEFGGLANVMPVFSALFLVVTLSSIALPLLNGFVGEFLILVGTFTSKQLPYAITFASFASLGMILSAVYMLWMYQRVIYGEVTNPENKKLTDINFREKLALAPLIALIFVMGIYPTFFLARSSRDISLIVNAVNPSAIAKQTPDAAEPQVAKSAETINKEGQEKLGE